MSPTLPPRPLRVQTDARLLQLARQGEAAAFEALVRRYRRQLLGYCRRLGLRDGQAEDALQQGLLHAWRALCRGDDVLDAKSWMYRVVHNAALDARRRSGNDHIALDEGVHGCVELSAAGELDRRLAVHATLGELAALPRMQREALVRTAVHGDSHEQVASALGLSHAAVRGLVHRARLALRTAAGALVPERLLQWLLRWGVESGVAGAPELGTGSAGAGGLLAALAKGSAVLVTGGFLASGLAAVQHGHRVSQPPAAGRRASSELAPTSASDGEGTLLASVAASHDASVAPAGSARTHSADYRMGGKPSPGPHIDRFRTRALRRGQRVVGGASAQPPLVDSSPGSHVRPRQSAPVKPPHAVPSRPPREQSAQIAHGHGEDSAQGGGFASGGDSRGSDGGRGSDAGQASGVDVGSGAGQDTRSGPSGWERQRFSDHVQSAHTADSNRDGVASDGVEGSDHGHSAGEGQRGSAQPASSRNSAGESSGEASSAGGSGTGGAGAGEDAEDGSSRGDS